MTENKDEPKVPMKNKLINKVANNQEGGARKALIEDLFYDYYRNRRHIYHVNFIRGLYFGFGSVLGGTLLVALLIWALSLFSDQVPFIQNVIDTINMQSE